MTRKSQSDPGERWIVPCCGLNKRLERSFTVGLLGILSELTGVPVPRRRVPDALGLAVACGSEFWADHVIGRTPRATVTGVRLTRRTMHFDPTQSLAVLGLASRPVRESLADAVAWLRQTGPIAASGDGTERTMLLIGLAPDDVRMRRAPDGRRESEAK